MVPLVEMGSVTGSQSVWLWDRYSGVLPRREENRGLRVPGRGAGRGQE